MYTRRALTSAIFYTSKTVYYLTTRVKNKEKLQDRGEDWLLNYRRQSFERRRKTVPHLLLLHQDILSTGQRTQHYAEVTRCKLLSLVC